MSAPVAIVGAGAVSAFGIGWRGLGRAVAAGHVQPRKSVLLRESHPGTLASEVPEIRAALDAGDARARKLMSRAARFAAIAMREALADASFRDRREEIGAWMGVGASGIAMEDVPAIVSASFVDGGLSLHRLGDQGLRACNPLFTFQTLNNFSLCHGAILEGLGGPNAAFFSRGSGTATALAEALHALQEGDCDRAIAGGADTALHPVTWAELRREGFSAHGLVPGEGAAVLALARGTMSGAVALLESCTAVGSVQPGTTAVSRELERLPQQADLVVIAPWGAPPRAWLRDVAASRYSRAALVDVSLRLGESLAATPALAWVTALDLLRPGQRAVVLTLGVDGDLTAAVFRKESP
ncbi:MAG: beta-ketoacyl synthase N-terminal-like domain-containing protein [Myxococcales bacterium]